MVSRPALKPADPGPDELLTLAEISAKVKRSKRTIQLHVKNLTFPQPYIRRGQFVRWRRVDVDEWVERLHVASGQPLSG